MRLILISGLSGSGKSIALNYLEDLGFFCVDNLPLIFLKNLVLHYQAEGLNNLAISVDSRSGETFEAFPQLLAQLTNNHIQVDLLFLEATENVLLKRFSETRRRHPRSESTTSLEEAIAQEADLLTPIRERAHRIDTSNLSAPKLRQFIKQWLDIPENTLPFHLTFESFGYKYGLPQDADYVFDVRCLPNPYYDSKLRLLTGLDAEVCHYFEDKIIVWQMVDSIEAFLNQWFPAFKEENRFYLTVAIGCTGGQHRSVFICQNLKKRFAHINAQVRHRQLLEK